MNKYLTIILVASLLFSCKSDIEKLRAERSEITKEIADYHVKLEKINEEIAKLEKKSESETILPYTISSQPFQHGITIQSSVSTDQDVILYPEYAGSITWSVSEGQRVGKGQVLASINDGGMSSQLKQAQIQADLAKTAFDKQARLWNEYKIGSEIQYLQAKTAYEAAQKSISAIQSQLSRTKLKAPFSGTIDNLIVQSGQAVAPGVPIAKLVSLGNLKVSADVSEQFISKVKVGTLVNVYIPALNRTMQSRVARVSSAINPSNRTFAVEIPLSNADNMIKTNMSAKLDIVDYQNANALSVPNKAIGTNAKGEKYVYVLKKINKNNAVASKTIIQVGQANSENTEVLQGLNVGDKIILEGNKSVVDNTPVKF
ncbi:MAG: efflux RND transporter periplasmic adaptor subunit [Chitinophagales bacterium]|nr:efflux RND transporter periplasmic adaptor subunit [Chitinophagales bacterium]